jgi:hypothetical protein
VREDEKDSPEEPILTKVEGLRYEDDNHSFWCWEARRLYSPKALGWAHNLKTAVAIKYFSHSQSSGGKKRRMAGW